MQKLSLVYYYDCNSRDEKTTEGLAEITSHASAKERSDAFGECTVPREEGGGGTPLQYLDGYMPLGGVMILGLLI